MNRHAIRFCLLALLAFLAAGCVTQQQAASGPAAQGQAAHAPAPPAKPVVAVQDAQSRKWDDSRSKADEKLLDYDSRTVLAATLLQMMGRSVAKAPVSWAPGGSFKARYEKFGYDGFVVTGIDVFDQQPAPHGRISVQALVRMRHPASGARLANVMAAVYADGKNGRPVIHKTVAGPMPSRDPVLEVRVVPSDAVRKERAFREASFPGWLGAARRLAVSPPGDAKDKGRYHVFVFAMERTLARPSLKVDTGKKLAGRARCINDNGFTACVVAGELYGQTNKAVFYLNGRKASEAPIK